MKKDFREELTRANLKVTTARVAILNVFSDDCGPLNAEDIFKKMKGKNKSINQVTVYRTVTSLEKAGILKRVDLQKEAVYYELNHHHHHHMICKNCGTLEEFKLCDIDTMTKKVLKSSLKFSTIQQHSFELFGICKKCVGV